MFKYPLICIGLIIVSISASSIIKEAELNDDVKCQRMGSQSVYANFVNCISQKPLPLKGETTITFLKTYYWYRNDLNIYIMTKQLNKTRIDNNSRCYLGLPTQGNKNVGDKLTISITCPTYPQVLKQGDTLLYTYSFLTGDKLVYFATIPGYSTTKDIEIIKQKLINKNLMQQ